METAPESGNISQGIPRTPRASGQFRDAKALFKSASTAGTTSRRSGPGRTYLAQIDVSLRAVGRETLTRLGNSRATASVILLLLLLDSALQARTRVASPILYLSAGHRFVVTTCLLSPCLSVSTRLLPFPRPTSTTPLPLKHGLGTQMCPTFAWLSWSGLAGHAARSSQVSHASRILSMYTSFLCRGIGLVTCRLRPVCLSLLGSSNVAWSSAMLSCTAGQG